jgi:hypothetical protein
MLLALAAPLTFSACATLGPPLPPSLHLPKPPTDLRSQRKGDRVILTWTVPTLTTDRQVIRTLGPTEVCRGGASDLRECGTPIATVAASSVAPAGGAAKQPSATYTDMLSPVIQSDDPLASATYGVEVLNTDGRGAGLSNQVHVPLIRSLPPPQDFQAHVTSQGVVLSWVGPTNATPAKVHYVYRIFRRRVDEQQQPSVIGEVPASGEHAYSFTDSQIEWQKTYEYHAETVTVIATADRSEIQVEGDDTLSIRVFADDVFPPAVPSGLQAVFSGPGQRPFIDLVWAPVSDIDLAGYNVYRHPAGEAPVKINTELLKTPAYRDMSIESGQRYLYSVTAVDLRGNESARSEEASESVPE